MGHIIPPCYRPVLYLPVIAPCYISCYPPFTGPPQVISPVTQRQIARVGDTVRLSCPVEADPTPLLQWSKDGESINRSWER